MDAPHLQFRLYADNRTYSVDYYDNVEDTQYADYFHEHFLQLIRKLEYDFGPNNQKELRATPFYFTQCTHCQVIILTNREVGYKLDCQRCQQRHQTTPFDFEGSAVLIDKIHQKLGFQIEPADVQEYVLIVQATDESCYEEIGKICARYGFIPVTSKHLLAFHTYFQGLQNNTLNPERGAHFFKKLETAAEAQIHGKTPLLINAVVEEIHRFNPGSRTLSSNIYVDDSDLTSLIMRGHADAATIRILQETIIDPGNVELLLMLVGMLTTSQQLEEAETYMSLLEMLVLDDQNPDLKEQYEGQVYNLKGSFSHKKGEYHEAIGWFKRSLVRDPLNNSNYLEMMLCYKRLGRLDKVREINAKMSSQGGILRSLRLN